jgi:putative hydrolase of the HAD superfamily
VKYATVIFDLGKVIFAYSWQHAYDYFAELCGLSADEVKERLDLEHDAHFQNFERGIVTPQEYADHVNNLLDAALTLPQFIEGWNAIYEEAYEGIEAIMAELELKYLLVGLSNTNTVHAAEWRERYADQLVYLSYIFCSHELHARKPDEAIYEHVLRSTGTRPQECIFFDDRADNIEGARKVGIQAFQVTSPAEIRAALKELGI